MKFWALLFLQVLFGCLAIGPLYSADSQSPSLYPASVQREGELVRSIFVATNGFLEAKICAAVVATNDVDCRLLFKQISFVFYYPTGPEDIFPSSSEMSTPYELFWKGGRSIRIDFATNEVPMNYVRISDPFITNIVAEMEVLVRVDPVGTTTRPQFVRRQFDFAWRNGWSESGAAQSADSKIRKEANRP